MILCQFAITYALTFDQSFKNLQKGFCTNKVGENKEKKQKEVGHLNSFMPKENGLSLGPQETPTKFFVSLGAQGIDNTAKKVEGVKYLREMNDRLAKR